jgi:hypothetical protein
MINFRPKNGGTMKNYLFSIGILIAICSMYSCGTPIEKYKAKNDDEKQIIDLLIRYTDAVNKGDSDQIVPLFHENGVYIASGGNIILSREKMSKWKPEDWTASGIRKIYNPEITINGNEAKVTAKVKYGNVSYEGIHA